MTRNSETIFSEARAMTGEARAAYLKGACGDDMALRSKVEALLRADAEAEGFLETVTRHSDNGAPPEDASIPSEEAGQVIGRYRLQQHIGEGGFGTVWMAEQKEPVKRRVALKIIKLGMDTKQVVARFEAERQALAMMDHPNIAKVLDAGATDTGRPYFVMEYVRGVGILEYCDKEKLDPRSRLELFIKVCQAIQHAHQKGIIHRDIKPSNVMITMHDGVPVPKVIDFGVAKATNTELTQRTLFTEHRQMIGTPAYMSPEQAEMSGLDIDTRSDVYSLGVLLYELLTGTTPFDSQSLMDAGFAEMMRIIREQEPHKPSTRLSSLGETATKTAEVRRVDTRRLSSMLRGDLDWIVMKCLEKDRTRRYDTANGLAMDIERHLNDEPVVAGPPSGAYRLRKFVRRNRTSVIATLAVAAAIGIGVTVSVTAMSARARAAELRERAWRQGQLYGGKLPLAVLPLENATGDPAQDFFADGTTMTLIAHLATIHTLHVRSGDSVIRFKGSDEPLSEIARQLDVPFVLKSAIDRDHDRVRIDVELLQPMRGKQYWQESFEDDLRHIDRLQNDVALAVADILGVELTVEEKRILDRTKLVDPEAHVAYLRGRHKLILADEASITAAIDDFTRAIEIDPEYALAYAARADAYQDLEEVYKPPLETMPQSRADALKAVELDPELAEAHVALGQVRFRFEWDWEQARRDWQRAIELNPELAAAHLAYANYLVTSLRREDAMKKLEEAQRLDPTSVLDEQFGLISYQAAKYDAGIEYCEAAMAIDPDLHWPWMWRGMAYAEKGDFKRAIEDLEHAMTLDDSPIILEFAGGVYARAHLEFPDKGYRKQALEILDELERQSEYRFICPYEVATIHIALDDHHTAYLEFERAIDVQSACIPWLRGDPRLDVLRDDPEFLTLLMRTNQADPVVRLLDAAALEVDTSSGDIMGPAAAGARRFLVPHRAQLHNAVLQRRTLTAGRAAAPDVAILDRVIYVAAGSLRIQWGEDPESFIDAEDHDFVFVPSTFTYQVTNAGDAPVEFVTVRSDGEQ